MVVAAPQAGTYTPATTSASTAVPYPPSVNAGACLVVVGSSSGSNATSAITTPGGWTDWVRHSSTGDTALPVLWGAIKNARATGSEGGTNLTITHSSGVDTAWQILAFDGVDATTAVEYVISGSAGFVDQTSAVSSSSVIPGATITNAGTALLAIGAQNATAGSGTPPSGFTETGDRTTNTRTFEVSYLTGVANGATGNKTITWAGQGRSIAAMLGLRPAAPTVLGTLAVTDDADTLAASGKQVLTGTLAVSDAADTLAAAGIERFAGTLAVTDDPDTLAAAGTAVTTYTGTLAVTDANDTSAAVGIQRFAGTLSATDDTDTLSAAGVLRLLGTLAVTDANDTLAALGVERFTGSLALTDDPDTLAASGSSVVRVAGTLAVTEADDTLAAIGHLIGVNDGHPVDNPTLALTTATGTLTITTTSPTLELTTPQPTLELTGAI